MRIFLFSLFYCAALAAAGQDITGIWRGNFVADNRLAALMGQEDKYKFEVQLNQDNKTFTGVTYSYKTTVFYGKASCYGAINKQTKKVLLEELKLLELKTSSGDTACIMTCFLQYSKVDNEEFLEGSYMSMSTADSSNCGRGTVFLRKVATSDFYKEPFLVNKEKAKAPAAKVSPSTKSPLNPASSLSKAPPARNANPAPAVKAPANKKVTAPPLARNTKPAPKPDATTPAITPRANDNLKVTTDDSFKQAPVTPIPKLAIPQVLATRKNELVKTITTSAKEISLNIYDNGAVDNDTVSVYLDKKLVVSKQRLTEKPISVKFSLDDENDQHELIMVAENLGEIPPNTSLMVVTAGTQQYEVRITSTEQKNAAVVFKYQP